MKCRRLPLYDATRLKPKKMTGQTTKPIRIAILLGAPFTEQNFERVGIPYLSSHFEVMVFDCLNWLGRDAGEIKCKRAHWQHFTTINTESDLDAAMRDFKPDYAIDAIGLGSYTVNIQNLLVRHNVKFVVPRAGALPVPGVTDRLSDFFAGKSLVMRAEAGDLSVSSTGPNRRGMNRKRIGILIAKLIGKVRQVIAVRKNITPPDICLLAGNKSLDFYTKKSPTIIWIGSNDFHQFNKARLDVTSNRNGPVEGGYLLFIDDAIATANDWKILNIKPPVTASEYYPMLRAFFGRLESFYGVPVVIAGHPNSKSDDSYSSNLGGRKVFFGETAALVLQSTMVLIHGSTATSYAVLARKPTMFFTTRELDGAAYGIHVRTMAKSLGRPLVFMDDLGNDELGSYPIEIDERKYKLYETNYLRSALSREDAPWQAFINFVNGASKVDVRPTEIC